MINLDELASRIETHDRWRFVTTNGIEATHAIARDENGDWHVWYMHGSMWLPIPPDRRPITLDEAYALIRNRREYYRVY